MVKWTAHAKAQVRHIYYCILEDSPLYAKRVAEKLTQKTVGLDDLPRKGRKVSELNEDAVRELSAYSYRIIYEIKPDNLIVVLAVIHKRRDITQTDIPRA